MHAQLMIFNIFILFLERDLAEIPYQVFNMITGSILNMKQKCDLEIPLMSTFSLGAFGPAGDSFNKKKKKNEIRLPIDIGSAKRLCKAQMQFVCFTSILSNRYYLKMIPR